MEGSLPHGRSGQGALSQSPKLAPLDPARAETFILANTAPLRPPHVPEIVLRLADEAHELWLKTEDELDGMGLPPPFWAFAWAGGQGLARYVLDNPGIVRGKRVLDFAAGSGLVGIGAAKSGAAQVLCADIDPFCRPAVALNASLNKVSLDFTDADLTGTDDGWDVVLAGDVFYDRVMGASLMPWLTGLKARGASVIVGDPGRSYLPKSGLIELARYEVPVTRSLEDAEVKRTIVWALA